MEMNYLEIYNHIQEHGEDGNIMGKPTKYLMLGNRKLHAYHVTCEYIIGQNEDGSYIIDPQAEPAIYLEKDIKEQGETKECTKE